MKKQHRVNFKKPAELGKKAVAAVVIARSLCVQDFMKQGRLSKILSVHKFEIFSNFQKLEIKIFLDRKLEALSEAQSSQLTGPHK